MTDANVLANDPHQHHYRIEGPRNSQLWSSRYALFLQDVTAVFDGFKALDITDLGVGHNELRVVVGPNGAGKTTMCDVISGLTKPATGKVYFAGEDISALSDTQRAQRGIGRKFQIPNVFDSLTVWENMLLALPNPTRRVGTPDWFANRRSRANGVAAIAAIRLSTMLLNMGGRPTSDNADKIHAILKRVRLADHLHTPSRSLSHGQRQWLAISKLIIAEPKLLLVDEPAAGLTDQETELTAELLLELKGSHTIICIEHDMDFVRRLNSRVTVLDNGRVLAEGSLDEVSNNEDVIEAYLGR
ncbi:MAG TPA: ATP-binding cassette domain-containing protein [Tepidisphaeraceae bacterium]|jgi:urea transport system ATP-binding protein|nr:ATP-binding cassette domain-containing protein [Tepidisphaeraceae bacterium]